jgi:hypothetical protein
MMTTEKYPNLQIQPNTELIVSCSVCGQENYARLGGRYAQRPDVRLHELRISSNGFQCQVLKVCTKCLLVLRDATEKLVHGETTFTYSKEAK